MLFAQIWADLRYGQVSTSVTNPHCGKRCTPANQRQDSRSHHTHLMWVLEIQVAPEPNWGAPCTLYWLTAASASIGRPAKDETVVDVVVAGDSSGMSCMYGYGRTQPDTVDHTATWHVHAGTPRGVLSGYRYRKLGN